MASQAYYSWNSGGRPYRLCRPAAALQKALRGHGLTVYDYPDDSHLKASTPEDHTPFSATGWPVRSAYGVGHGVDIMPRTDTAAGRAENAAIARRLIADRNAGLPGVAWIKYVNWTDEQGVCRQERWMPTHETRSSTDRGHIHVSGRSDCDDDTRAEGYDPLNGGISTMADDYGSFGKPPYLVEGRPAAVMIADIWGQLLRGVSPYDGRTPADLIKLFGRLEAKLDAALKALGVAQSDLNDIQARTGGVTDTQVSVIADRVAQALVARPDTPLSAADVPTLVEAFKQAAREGTGA